MENTKELLENIIRTVVECTFSNKIEVEIKEDLSLRFIEMPEYIAEVLGFKNEEIVKVKTEGIKAVIFENVKILVNKDIVKKRFFINLNEARAANLENEFIVEILKEEHTNLNRKTKDEISYKFEKEGIYTKLI